MTIFLNRRQTLFGGTLALAFGAMASSHTKAAYAEVSVEGAGRIHGVLRFTGDLPSEDKISISKDSHICGTGHVNPNPLTRGADNELLNGVVTLRKVASGKAWPTDLTEPKIVQEACLFEPFVQVAPKGSDLTILNKDPLLHNIHAYEQIGRARRTMFNIAQPAAGQIDVSKLKMRRGSVVEIDCDAHNWMSAWIYMSDHPYVAVTAADGRFDLPETPPGSYEIVMWHPQLGEKTSQISIGSGETLDLSLDMKS